MDKFTIDQLEFRCQQYGASGSPLVLLHGYGGGPLDWHDLLPALAAQHRVWIPNLTPLFSSSSPISFTKQVEVIAKLIDQLNSGRERFAVMGSSYGATLSFGLRAHFKGLMDGHIMVNPMPLNPLGCLKSPSLKMLFGMNMVPGALPLFLKSGLGQNLLLELGEAFGFGGLGRKGLKVLSSRKLELISKAVQRFAWIAQHENWEYWQEQLREDMIPTLLVTGQQDPLFDEREFRSYQYLVPMSEHHSIPAAAHMLVKTHHQELAELFLAYVRSLKAEPDLALAI